MPGYSIFNRAGKIAWLRETDQMSIIEPVHYKEKYKIVRHKFIKAIPSIDSLINRSVLKKIYSENGQLFEYTDDLNSNIPQKKFKYRFNDISGIKIACHEVDQKGVSVKEQNPIFINS